MLKLSTLIATRRVNIVSDEPGGDSSVLPPDAPVSQPVAAAPESRWHRMRSPGPAPLLAEHSMAWALDLPRETRPNQLLLRYPRVANRLALVWRDIKLTDSVFDSLAKSTRSGRSGFPASVATELRTLHEHHMKRKLAARRQQVVQPSAPMPVGSGPSDAWSEQATSDR